MKTLLPLLFGLATACTQAPAPADIPAEPARLNVYIWTNYHSPAAIERFERENNAKVVIDTYDNNEVIEQKLQAGIAPYDIVVPSDYMVVALARQGLLQTLDESRLPSLANLDPMLDWEKAAGAERHAVPYLWGTTGYGYRTDRFPDGLDSWAPLFDPANKGHIIMLDDMREDFAAALKSLGISLNTTDETELRQAQKRLIEQRDLVVAYDSSDFAGKLLAGDGWLVHGYSGELAIAARESGGKLAYVLPKEGATLAIDNLAIPTAAPNTELAYRFLEFMLQADIAAETANHTGYATTNAAAKANIAPEVAADPAVYPSAEVLKNCQTMQDLGETTALLDELWTEIKVQ